MAKPKSQKVVFHSNLDGYWVGSLDFNFLVETKLCFPLNPPKVVNFLQGGSCSNQETSKRAEASGRGKPFFLRLVAQRIAEQEALAEEVLQEPAGGRRKKTNMWGGGGGEGREGRGGGKGRGVGGEGRGGREGGGGF